MTKKKAAPREAGMKGAPRGKVAGAIAPTEAEHAPAIDPEHDDAPMMQAHSGDTTYEHVTADGVVEDRPAREPEPAPAAEPAPTPSVEEDGQLNALGKPADPEASMELRFSSADEVLSTAQALSARAADLRALAKKAREIGRQREAISIEREASHIGEFLLPQVQAQIGIPFDDMEELLDALVRSVGRTVRNATARAIANQLVPIEGESDADTQARRKELLDNFETVVGAIAEHAAAAVMPYIEETAERSYAAGLEARNATPKVLARQAVQAAATKQD